MAKKTTCKIQEEYMVAKAAVETIMDQERELERQYILEHGITNPDGSTPDCLWIIEDDATADKAIEDCCELSEKAGIYKELRLAETVLAVVEEKMIAFALSIIPRGMAEERRTLEEGAKKNHTTRQKLIDLTLQLDVSTLSRR